MATVGVKALILPCVNWSYSHTSHLVSVSCPFVPLWLRTQKVMSSEGRTYSWGENVISRTEGHRTFRLCGNTVQLFVLWWGQRSRSPALTEQGRCDWVRKYQVLGQNLDVKKVKVMTVLWMQQMHQNCQCLLFMWWWYNMPRSKMRHCLDVTSVFMTCLSV